ncbi:MAG: class I SAM-dependent methyltransferase, partial [Chloroflexi bacterium]|nr:class I SAM-dependent methyltransferase [Chloroflexota bacterium]
TGLRYDDQCYDAVLFSAQGFMCIPRAGNRLRALMEVRRILRRGGHFIFTTHDREATQHYLSFWEEEKVRWDEGVQDPRLLEFGDRIVVDSGTDTFVHFPTREEVAELVLDAGLDLIQDAMRSELCLDTEEARRFSSDCRMWVVRRPRD